MHDFLYTFKNPLTICIVLLLKLECARGNMTLVSIYIYMYTDNLLCTFIGEQAFQVKNERRLDAPNSNYLLVFRYTDLKLKTIK